MAKAASPVRLEKELMRSASSVGERFHRSAAEQVEYWASIGQSVSRILDPDILLAVTTGLSRLKVEPVIGPVINPDDVFEAQEKERRNGTLADAVTKSHVKYQASMTYPGYLERISLNGQVEVGQFDNGKFIPMGDQDA